jgi:diaminopimelate epimerase
LMSGPAEPVFDAVVAPSLLEGLLLEAQPTPTPIPAQTAAPDPGTIDCAVACVEGCRQPQDCPSAEARARVEALLGSRSLDELVEIATSTAELRSRERILRNQENGS